MPGPRDSLVHRTHADDLAGRLRHLGDDALPQHRAHRLAAAQELAREVDRQNSVPIRQRHIDKRRVALHARIGDQDVEAAEMIDCLAEHRDDLGFVGNVSRSASASAPDLRIWSTTVSASSGRLT
jgi:DNA-binding ferritin-like protein